MLSALLGAICAASLAFAPVSASASVNADLTPTVHSAYYDSSNVAEYGTTALTAYNYTSYTYLLIVETDGTWYEEDYSANTTSAPLRITSNGQNCRVGASNTQGTTGNFILTNTLQESNQAPQLTIDWYLNGVLQGALTSTDINENGCYLFRLPQYETAYYNQTDYIWFFDHQDYQLGTDTVADIAEGLTSGIGTVATGIGGGLQSLMQNIFLVGTVDDETGAFTATGLSTFGVVTVVFCGLALALGLSRWIVGFASSLGSRNR